MKSKNEGQNLLPLFIYNARYYQHALKAQQEWLLNSNGKNFEKTPKSDELLDDLGKKIQDQYKQDLQAIEVIKEKIASYQGKLPYPVKYHKLVEISNGVEEIIQNQDNLDNLLEGKLPNAISNSIPIGKLDNGYFGTSNSTFLSQAILYSYNVYEQSKVKQTSDLWKVPAISVPFELPQDLAEQLPKCSMIEVIEGKSYLKITHSGYAFGGMRVQILPENINFNELPHDCAYMVERGLNSDIVLSTADLAAIYNYNSKTGYTNPGWLESKQNEIEARSNLLKKPIDTLASDIISCYTPVSEKDVQQGDIWFMKNYTSQNQKSSYGTGGHCGIVAEVSQYTVTILECNRDMPKIEGYLLATVNKNDWTVSNSKEDVLKKVCYLRYSGDLPVSSQIQELYQGDYNQYELNGFLEYCDKTITDLLLGQTDQLQQD